MNWFDNPIQRLEVTKSEDGNCDLFTVTLLTPSEDGQRTPPLVLDARLAQIARGPNGRLILTLTIKGGVALGFELDTDNAQAIAMCFGLMVGLRQYEVTPIVRH